MDIALQPRALSVRAEEACGEEARKQGFSLVACGLPTGALACPLSAPCPGKCNHNLTGRSSAVRERLKLSPAGFTKVHSSRERGASLCDQSVVRSALSVPIWWHLDRQWTLVFLARLRLFHPIAPSPSSPARPTSIRGGPNSSQGGQPSARRQTNKAQHALLLFLISLRLDKHTVGKTRLESIRVQGRLAFFLLSKSHFIWPRLVASSKALTWLGQRQQLVQITAFGRIREIPTLISPTLQQYQPHRVAQPADDGCSVEPLRNSGGGSRRRSCVCAHLPRLWTTPQAGFHDRGTESNLDYVGST